MSETLRRCSDGIIEELPVDDVPAPLSSQYEKRKKNYCYQESQK